MDNANGGSIEVNDARDNIDIYNNLRQLCQNNEDFFSKDHSEYGLRLREAFYGLRTHIDSILPVVTEIRQVAPLYDFDDKTPGNGYRSFVGVVDCCILHSIKLASQVSSSRDNLLFRKGHYMKEIEACSHLLASLNTCVLHLKTMLTWCEVGELFPIQDHRPEELFATTSAINQYSFYGRCLGFQFCESMRSILKGLSICMAGFSEAYYSNGSLLSKATSSVFAGGKYVMDPELRARRIVNISQSASIDFCKSFWSLSESEMMHRLPSVICNHSIAVNRIISIPPEKLELPSVHGEGVVEIPIPTSHGGPAPIQVRLISSRRREGMIGEANNECVLPSRGLVIHCHGGGFVAQSSKSHELYLREWAAELNVPILSIDYSLAPAAPFPRALEEVYYAYCWALNNCHLLGSTAERVVLAGDSAGANLNLGLTLRCVESGIRKPSGLFLAYVPVLVSFVPSPARLLCLMDPLLPFGFMMRCLKAYACPSSSSYMNNNATTPMSCPEHTNQSPVSESYFGGPVSESDLADLQAHRSHAGNDSDTLTSVSLSSINANVQDLQQDNQIECDKHNSNETKSIEVDNKNELYIDNRLIISEDDKSQLIEKIDDSKQFIIELNAITVDNSNEKSLLDEEKFVETIINDSDKRPLNDICGENKKCTEVNEAATTSSTSSGGGGGSPGSRLTDALHGLMVRTRNVKNGIKKSLVANGLTSSIEEKADIIPIKDSTVPIKETNKFVDDFLEKYVLDINSGEEPRSRQPTTSYEDLSLSDIPNEVALGIHERITRAARNFLASVTNTFSNMTSSNQITTRYTTDFAVQNNLDALIARSPSDEFIFQVPRDPYLSPYWAEDSVLKQMPPIHILTIELDPCLDDCVMFAKKLKALGNTIGLDILSGLPHGFLNFSMMSKEAHRGSVLCTRRISELLDLKHLP